MNHESTLGDYDDYADEPYDPSTTRAEDQDPSKNEGKVLANGNNTTAGSYSYQGNDDGHYQLDGHYNEDDYDEEMVEDPSNKRTHFRDETFTAPEDYNQAMTKKNSSTSASSLRGNNHGINETAVNNRAKATNGGEEVDGVYHHNQHHGTEEARGNERLTEEVEEEADEDYDESPGSPTSFEKMKVLEDLANLVKEKERNLNGLMNKLVEDFTAYVHAYDKNMKIYGKIHANVQQESHRLDRCEEEVGDEYEYLM